MQLVPVAASRRTPVRFRALVIVAAVLTALAIALSIALGATGLVAGGVADFDDAHGHSGAGDVLYVAGGIGNADLDT